MLPGMAYAVTIQGAAGLRGSDMQFQCTSTSCVGVDAGTQNYFRALQAQLNRYVAYFLKKATNPALVSSYKLKVDGKLGHETVLTYKFVSDGLIRGGVPLIVTPKTVSKDTLARNADDLANMLQAVADRAGLPPGDVSVPGAPSANSAGSFGPSTNVGPTASPLPPDLIAAIKAGAFTPPTNPSLPAILNLPNGSTITSAADTVGPGAGTTASGSSIKDWLLYGGIGAAAIALFAFTIKRRNA